ncbi:MAG: transcriptional repressor LexA [Lysobacterales bacterium]|nr:transcriptional repressor LexA [Xanthomonadales bacterium]MCP5475787.1 transcriptional repressor LexA [Rhodanobacteraceae bacterium]
MSKDDLTPRQRQILDFIDARLRQSGAPPTRAEIAAAFGFRSANAAEEHLRALVRKGAIAMAPGRSRGIRVLKSTVDADAVGGQRSRSLPLIGQVAAGSPILAVENVESEVRLDASVFHPVADYLLRVRGDSMIDVGIMDGDLLAVHRSASAESGQIVVARLGEEVTVKRLERHGESLRLCAENPAYQPIEVDPARDDFALEGLAVGVLRRW